MSHLPHRPAAMVIDATGACGRKPSEQPRTHQKLKVKTSRLEAQRNGILWQWICIIAHTYAPRCRRILLEFLGSKIRSRKSRTRSNDPNSWLTLGPLVKSIPRQPKIRLRKSLAHGQSQNKPKHRLCCSVIAADDVCREILVIPALCQGERPRF